MLAWLRSAERLTGESDEGGGVAWVEGGVDGARDEGDGEGEGEGGGEGSSDGNDEEEQLPPSEAEPLVEGSRSSLAARR